MSPETRFSTEILRKLAEGRLVEAGLESFDRAAVKTEFLDEAKEAFNVETVAALLLLMETAVEVDKVDKEDMLPLPETDDASDLAVRGDAAAADSPDAFL